MAKVALSSATTVVGWNSRMDFPKDRYTLRCIEEDIKPSKGGNPMVHLKWEICCGAPVQFGENLIDVDGLKIDVWMVTKVKDGENDDGTPNWDEEKSSKALGRYIDLLKVCGAPADMEIDDENPPAFFLKKVVDAVVYATKEPSRKEPTPEQKKRGQPGDVIKDAFGKEVVTYKLAIEQVLGLSTTETNRPY